MISKLFKHFAEHGIPRAWNLVQVTPVHKRGSQADARNYCPVSIMEPLAKLYARCLNLELETRAVRNQRKNAETTRQRLADGGWL